MPFLFFEEIHVIPGLLGIVAERQFLPLMMVEEYFLVQHNSLCLQDVVEASLLERLTFPPVLQVVL